MFAQNGCEHHATHIEIRYCNMKYVYIHKYLRSITFGSFGVWPKMTQFSESRLILLVCLVLLPSGHTITTIDILNMTEHGLHPGHSHIPSTNAYKCTELRPKLPAKRLQKPANARKSKNLANLYNFGGAQLTKAKYWWEDWEEGHADGKHSHDIPRLTFWGNARYDHKFGETPHCAKRLISLGSWKAQVSYCNERYSIF